MSDPDAKPIAPTRDPSEGHTWSAMDNGNAHNPERWVPVRFLEATI